jgi:hypothetical protein
MLETKGNKILENVKTRWISMLNPVERLKVEYKTLLVKMVLYKPQAKQNYELFVTCRSCWDLLISCHYWNLCMFWLYLHICRMCLCVTLWLLSRFAKVICITCIWNKVWTPLQVPIGHSSPCLSVNMKTSTWSGYLIFWTLTFGLWNKWPAHVGNALWLWCLHLSLNLYLLLLNH